MPKLDNKLLYKLVRHPTSDDARILTYHILLQKSGDVWLKSNMGTVTIRVKSDEIGEKYFYSVAEVIEAETKKWMAIKRRGEIRVNRANKALQTLNELMDQLNKE